MLTEYTKIKNEILDALLGANLNGTEISVALFVIRKTYGFNKKSDKIATSQFCKAIPSSKSAIERAKLKLTLVRILTLVSKGTPDGVASEWALNKNVSEWTLVPKMTVVPKIPKPSVINAAEVVSKMTPTKDTITKDNTKDSRVGMKKFIPPTQPEASSFFLEMHSTGEESENFIDFYQSKGWIVGRVKMKDWRAAARRWIRNNQPKEISDRMKRVLGVPIS